MRLFLSTLLLLSLSISSLAQVADKTSFDGLHLKRQKTNLTGMTVLGTWGAANLTAGAIGYFTANDEEWKAFHGMNAIWGAVNLGIGVMGYIGTKRDMKKDLTCDQMLKGYESTKRLYLINGGLDLAYIGSGLLLNAYADEFNDPAKWRGFGKSIAVQGAALLIFDGTMFSLHQHQNKNWYKLMQGICFTGNGVGYKYTF